MTSIRTYSTAALLAAFTTLTLTAPSYAGWVKTGSTYDFQIGSGTDAITSVYSNCTYNLSSSITDTDPSQPLAINLTSSKWFATGDNSTINLAGKVNITSSASFSFAALSSLSNSTLTLADTAILKISSSDNRSQTAIYGVQNIDYIGGKIELNTPNGRHVAGIKEINDSITIDNFAESAHISVSASNFGYGIYVSGLSSHTSPTNLTINRLAGDITNNSSDDEGYAIYCRDNITIGTFTKDSQITLQNDPANHAFAQGYGIFSNSTINITGECAGQIIGTPNSRLTAIYASDTITINSVSSDFLISLNARGTGFIAHNAINITNSYAGKINITATDYNAYAIGFNAYNGTINIPTFAKEASINLHSTKHKAQGFTSQTLNTNTFAGDITVQTDSDYYSCYAIDADNLNIDTITSDSQITATASNSKAFAINSKNIDIKHIHSNISASGKLAAIAILGTDTINLADITGSITATASPPDAKVAAISTDDIANHSGYTTGDWTSTNTNDDIVTIANGGSVTGDIRLGGQTTTGDVLTLKNNATIIGNLVNIETLNLIQDTPSLTIPSPVFNLTTNANVDKTSKINSLDTVHLQAGTLNFAGNLNATTFTADNNTTIQTTGNITTDSLVIRDDCTIIVPINAAEKSTGTFVADTVTIGKNLTIKSKLDGPLRQTTTFTLIKANVASLIVTSEGENPIYMIDTALIDYESELSNDFGTITITASTFGKIQDHAPQTAFNASKSLQNALDATPNADTDAILAQFQAMDEPTLQKELQKITPQQSLSTAAASSSITTSFSGKLAGRTSTMSNTKLAAASSPTAYPLLLQSEQPFADTQYAFWTSAFGSISEQDDTDSIAGYQSRSAGSLIGLDRKLDNLLIGAALGFAHADIDTNQSRGSTDLDALSTAAYFAYAPSNFKIDGGVIYTLGFSDYKRETALGRTAEADDVTSHAFTNYLGLGKSFTSNNNRLTLTPHAQLTYTYFTQESYEESKANSLNLAVDSFDAHTLSSTLSLAAAYQYNEQLTLNSKLAYTYDISNDAPEATATFQAPGSTPFSTKGLETDKSAIDLGLGFNYQLNNKTTTALNYNYQHRSSYQSQSLTLNLRMNF